MINVFILLIIVISYIKIYIAFTKILKLKDNFKIFDKLIIPILSFEIICILLYFTSIKFNVLLPTIIYFISSYNSLVSIVIFSIIYISINSLLIITKIGLNDNLIPIYNLFLSIDFIITAMFTLRL